MKYCSPRWCPRRARSSREEQPVRVPRNVGCDQAEIKLGRADVQSPRTAIEVVAVQVATSRARKNASAASYGPAQQLEEGLRVAQAGQEINLAAGRPSMALVKVKPTSPGRRAVVKVVNPDLHKGRPHDALIERKTKNAGR